MTFRRERTLLSTSVLACSVLTGKSEVQPDVIANRRYTYLKKSRSNCFAVFFVNWNDLGRITYATHCRRGVVFSPRSVIVRMSAMLCKASRLSFPVSSVCLYVYNICVTVRAQTEKSLSKYCGRNTEGAVTSQNSTISGSHVWASLYYCNRKIIVADRSTMIGIDILTNLSR